MLRKEELGLHRDLCVFLNNNVFSYVKGRQSVFDDTSSGYMCVKCLSKHWYRYSFACVVTN